MPVLSEGTQSSDAILQFFYLPNGIGLGAVRRKFLDGDLEVRTLWASGTVAVAHLRGGIRQMTEE